MSPCIYAIFRIEEKGQNLIGIIYKFYIVAFLYEILEEFIFIASPYIYTVRSSETEDVQILWKFFEIFLNTVSC